MSGAASLFQTRWFQICICALFALGFIYVLVVNAWVVDDAYITFRTVDNFVNGYGLTWNVDERVQVYTHPLWMFVITLLHLITTEFFFTSMAACFLCSITAVIIVAYFLTKGFRNDLWRVPLLALGLLCSKAFIDFTSSGLENALSYLLAALFFSRYIFSKNLGLKNFTILFFIASLSVVNRIDSIIFYFPALIHLIIINRQAPKLKLIRLIIISTLPASLWILFSLVYYGFPFPNTAYAKVIATGYTASMKAVRGFEYLSNSIKWDSASHALIIIALFLCLKAKSGKAAIALIGALIFIGFVVLSAASATHQSGRFFSIPFFITIFVFVKLVSTPRTGVVFSILLAAYIALSPVSAVKFGTSAYHEYMADDEIRNHSHLDTKWYVYKGNAALLNWEKGKAMPDHPWLHYGERFRASQFKLSIGGAFNGEAIGYFGYAAGPEKFIIDYVALSDPFLARLPAILPDETGEWKSGHFHRIIPEGYGESAVSNKNLIIDPDLKKYYDIIRNITRGPLFSWGRFRDIFIINTGGYDYLIEQTKVKLVKPDR